MQQQAQGNPFCRVVGATSIKPMCRIKAATSIKPLCKIEIVHTIDTGFRNVEIRTGRLKR